MDREKDKLGACRKGGPLRYRPRDFGGPDPFRKVVFALKGDLAILGLVGAAMAAVPAAVLLWAGQPLLASAQLPDGFPLSSPVYQTEAPASSVPQDSPVSGSSTLPPPALGDSLFVQGEADPGEEALPPEVKGRWESPIRTLKILDQSTGEVTELSLFEYTQCAIAAEMPASYHLEALKAQGVAALTYALHQASLQRSLPESARDPALKGADLSADPGNRRGYMTEESARDFYGDQFDHSWAKITQAARIASRCVLLWEEEPIAAAYHAISAGETTERAENIWDGPLPYLVEVDSSWDILAPGYKSTLSVSDGELKEILTAAGAQLLPDAATWLEIEERSPAGYVTAIRTGNLTIHGNRLRNLLGLRSAAFELERTHSGYTFYVRGYGHGAGMSQAGADYLARQGQGFGEILTHYYTGAALTEIGGT